MAKSDQRKAKGKCETPAAARERSERKARDRKKTPELSEREAYATEPLPKR